MIQGISSLCSILAAWKIINFSLSRCDLDQKEHVYILVQMHISFKKLESKPYVTYLGQTHKNNDFVMYHCHLGIVNECNIYACIYYLLF